MGWLFNRNKKIVPKIPFPEPKSFDESELRFPQPDRDVKPEKVKAAVGFDKPLVPPVAPPQKKEIKAKPVLEKKEEVKTEEPVEEKSEEKIPILSEEKPVAPRIPEKFSSADGDEVFVKLEDYQKILGEVDQFKKDLLEVGAYQRKLESSEYNEENDFNKLKRIMKHMHDSVLQMDKTLFNE